MLILKHQDGYIQGHTDTRKLRRYTKGYIENEKYDLSAEASQAKTFTNLPEMIRFLLGKEVEVLVRL